MTTKRILVMAPEPFYQDRGTPIAVRLVLEALSELQHEVDVLTFPMGRDLEIPGVRIERTHPSFGIRSVPIGFSLRKVLLDVTMAGTLRRLLRQHEYAYVHAVEESAFLAALYARPTGVPVLYDMQSSLPEQMHQRPLFAFKGIQTVLQRCEAWLLNHVNVICGSTGLAEHVARLAPDTPFHEWTFPPSFPATTPESIGELRAELGVPDGWRIVLYSGTFESYQGLQQLIDSVPLVCQSVPNVVFLLVGADGRPGTLTQRAIAERGLTDRVRVVRRQARVAIGKYLAAADLVVSPRAGGKNAPLKIFDYLVAGKPIVATAIPAHLAVLDESRAHLVSRSPAALSAGIVRILEDATYADRLASAALLYARAHLGWNVFVRKVSDVADELIDASRPAAGRRRAAA